MEFVSKGVNFMEKVQKIRRFENIINKNEATMIQIIVLYNMKYHDNYKKMTDKQKEDLLGIIYNFYLKDETNTDLGHISEIAMANYEEILELQELGEFREIRNLISEEL